MSKRQIPPSLPLGVLSVDLREYAVQGNAVLGTRESGKSYSATYCAERLMDAGIPIVALDPTGIWRWLRVGAKGKGYSIVVAGGEQPDLPLTPDSAPEIVRAAMAEGVSIVLDLYSMKLSKADWHRIVERAVRVLLYENKGRGIRHIFLEEAEEFVPQTLNRFEPGQARAYAEIEKLARMGGNAQLGYTLIGHRPEQVNKAVLELCDMLLLFRQRGRRSLEALTKWLAVAVTRGSAELTSSLATLPHGDCWVWPAGSDTPMRTHIPEKRTYHPDRRAQHAQLPAKSSVVDVSKFVARLSTSLEKILETAAANDPARLRRKIAELERAGPKAELAAEYKRGFGEGQLSRQAELEEATRKAREEGRRIGCADVADAVAAVLVQFARTIQAAEAEASDAIKRLTLQAAVEEGSAQPSAVGGDLQKLPKLRPPLLVDGIRPIVTKRIASADGPTPPPAPLRILNALAELETIGVVPVDRTQLAFFADQSPRSSGYTNNLGALRSAGFIDYPSSGLVQLTEAGRALAEPVSRPLDTAALHERVKNQVQPALWRILNVAIEHYPDPLDRDQVAQLAGQSPTSSGYTNNLGRLRSLGLIDYPRRRQVVATPLLFLEETR
jgi:Mn-dependent DtxR family transcriptional regulator